MTKYNLKRHRATAEMTPPPTSEEVAIRENIQVLARLVKGKKFKIYGRELELSPHHAGDLLLLVWGKRGAPYNINYLPHDEMFELTGSRNVAEVFALDVVEIMEGGAA